jgi:hypothetical protein
MVDSYYMVLVVNGDDKVRSKKALGMDRITPSFRRPRASRGS